MKRTLLVGFILAFSPSLLKAETILDIHFDKAEPVDEAGNLSITQNNVVLKKINETGCAEFDGTSALVVAHDPTLSFADNSSFWAELWVNPLNIRALTPLLTKGTGANYSVILSQDGTFTFIYYSQGDWRTVSSEPGAVHLETWSHLAVYFDPKSGRAALFVNGIVVALVKDLPPFQASQDLPLYIGGQPTDESASVFAGFDGEMTGIQITRDSLPRGFDANLKMGIQAFEIKPLF